MDIERVGPDRPEPKEGKLVDHVHQMGKTYPTGTRVKEFLRPPSEPAPEGTEALPKHQVDVVVGSGQGPNSGDRIIVEKNKVGWDD